MTPRLRLFLLLLVAVFSAASAARADWRTDGGYFVLSAELGVALPTGAGITVFHCEADSDGVEGAPYVYLPQASAVTPFAGAGAYAGKTFHALAGVGSISGHSNAVGYIFYGPGGVANGVTTVQAHEANTFFDELTAANFPPVWIGTVQNHSWIGTTGSGAVDTDALRRFDFALNRDGATAVVALHNSTNPVPQLLSSSHHAICVGLRNGIHNRNGTVLDGIGRMKPDLVVNEGQTSYATPAIASAATLLYDAIRPGFPDADHPQAVKAILLAGASKKFHPAWQRDVTTEPYDDVFGAGELNILNAYHILVRGRQICSPTIEVSVLGWDHTTASSTAARRYFFTVPAGRMADTFSAALTWHRVVTVTGLPSTPTYNSSLPDLNLKLFASTAFTPAVSPIDQSNSSVDNVEHLLLRNLPPGQYMMEVTSNTDDHDYALAWEAQIGVGPVASPRRDVGGNVLIDCAALDPFVTYTVEKSGTLDPASWSSAGTFRTADTIHSTTHTWQDAGLPYPGARFYRLKWTSVR